MLQFNFTIQVECIQMARSNMRLILDCFVVAAMVSNLNMPGLSQQSFSLHTRLILMELPVVRSYIAFKVDAFTSFHSNSLHS